MACRLAATPAAQLLRQCCLLKGRQVGATLCVMICQHVILRFHAGRVRRKEAANIAKMNLIRGTNMALQFAVLPIAAFITFSVVRRTVPHGHQPCQESDASLTLPAASCGQCLLLRVVACGNSEALHVWCFLMQVWAQGKTLQVSSVFYALALLQVRLCILVQSHVQFLLYHCLLHLRLLWAVRCSCVSDIEVRPSLALCTAPAAVHGHLLHAGRGDGERAAHLAAAAGRVPGAARAAAAVAPVSHRRRCAGVGLHHGWQSTASSPRWNCPLAHQMSAYDRTW